MQTDLHTDSLSKHKQHRDFCFSKYPNITTSYQSKLTQSINQTFNQSIRLIDHLVNCSSSSFVITSAPVSHYVCYSLVNFLFSLTHSVAGSVSDLKSGVVI